MRDGAQCDQLVGRVGLISQGCVGMATAIQTHALVSYSLAVRVASRFSRWISSVCVSSIFESQA